MKNIKSIFQKKTEQYPKDKVLVVDDDPIYRDMLRMVLAIIGYRAITARDGVEAMELYKKSR